MIPPIKIQVSGNKCNCCTSDTNVREFKVVYRGDKNIFVAVPNDKDIPKETIAATREALKSILYSNYSVRLEDLSIELDPMSPPSIRQVRTIEDLASKALKRTDSSKTPSP